MQQTDTIKVEVFIGVDVAKTDHYACVVTASGEQVLARPVRNDETAIAGLLDTAAAHGAPALVIDTTSSTAALLMHAAAQRDMPVAYVTGLAMRRAADLYAGAAKTDPKDAAVLADYAMRNADRSGLGRPRRRNPGQLADSQRLRHRPRRRCHPCRQPHARRFAGGLAGIGTRCG